MKIHPRLVLIALFVSFIAVLPVQAQTSELDAKQVATLPSPAQTTATAAKPVADSLSTLPESDMVLYINASRILNDAIPRLVPEKELKKLRDGMDQVKAFTNVDLRHMEYLVVTMRFNKPSGGRMFPFPEAMLAVRGDFDAKALIGMGMMMSQGMLREEKFGDHTIYVLKLSDIAKEAAKNPFGVAFSEIAITTLDGSTLAIGNTNYIKAALDAAEGRGRIKSEILASLMRDPSALISATGSPLNSFAKTFGLRMAESNDPNCMTRFGEYYLALAMGENDFKISGAMNADNPETAGMVKNMLLGLLQDGKGLVPDKNVKTMLDQVKLIAEGSEVQIETTIPQEMAVRFIREALAPPPPKAAATEANKETTVTAGAQKTAKPKTTKRKYRRKKS